MRNAPGLPILSCADCGLCCHLQSAPPFMPTELDALPPALLAKLPLDDGPADDSCAPCSWLTAAKTCGHYEHRPEVCRQFEMGGEDCLEIRQRAGLTLLPDAPDR